MTSIKFIIRSPSVDIFSRCSCVSYLASCSRSVCVYISKSFVFTLTQFNFCKYCLDSSSVANDANSTSGRSEPGLSTEGAHKSNLGVEDVQKIDPGESSTRACVKNLLHIMILLAYAKYDNRFGFV